MLCENKRLALLSVMEVNSHCLSSSSALNILIDCSRAALYSASRAALFSKSPKRRNFLSVCFCLQRFMKTPWEIVFLSLRFFARIWDICQIFHEFEIIVEQSIFIVEKRLLYGKSYMMTKKLSNLLKY